ncbi:MAG: proton-conducting transporter membrane subunit, partial [Pseudomonadota bacterium]
TLILAAAAAGLALSGDLFNIYVFYELVSVASFGLVAVRRTGAALAATMRYLILSGFGAALALVGIGIVYHLTGTLNLAQLADLGPEMLNTPIGLTAFAAILIGVGVKAELFPVNTWVPEVYATAPKRVSALLAGLVSKLAVLVVVRLLVLVFHQPEALALLLTLGMLGVITGELAAWRARDMSRMLAFSSIGQLGIIFIAFALPGQAGLMAGLAMALHHLVVKPALFLLAERWGGSLEGLTGAAHRSPLGAALFVLFALSLVGVPPLPGFWAKLLVITGLAGQPDSLYLTAMAVILVATVVEAGYLFRVVTRLYQRRDEGDTRAAVPGHENLDLGTASAFGVALLAAVVLLVPLSEGLQAIATQAADTGRYISIVFPGGVTP